MRYGIDALVALEIARGGIAVHESHTLVGPGRLRSDAMAALYDGVATGALTRDEARSILEALTGVRIRLLNDRVSRATAWKLALSRDALSPTAAEYVAVARLQADALVTTDPDVAAFAEGLVEMAPVQALSQPSRADA
ncbi:hypothetical protein LGT39_11460 [Demequina sp. TTPB684]|uniref:hypothetical protein n=1 Tax=unclassified Demequina TaxID=2620311 RepID=UPI001CF3FF81|nr:MULTISPECIES: hypothetical protein [unclassified Demequina]MCB2413462.1 hypothetical protein [Demequina sp. TTPB684]UPU88765.1 hypothetical protein LGT36_002250 [Demequina sp. TMPB413]